MVFLGSGALEADPADAQAAGRYVDRHAAQN